MRSAAALTVLLAAALGVRAPAAAQEATDSTAPEWTLPPGISPEPSLPGRRAALVEGAAAALARPTTAEEAREGWRLLAAVGADAVPATVRALRAADWYGRALLVRGLGSMEEPRVLPLLETAARDPAWAVRAAAAEGLGLCIDGAAVPALLPLLADEAWRVRETAVRSLRRLALRGAVTAEAATARLLPLAEDPDLDVRLETWLALSDLRRPEAAAVLLPALRTLAEGVDPPDDDDVAARPDAGTLVALRVLRGLAEGHGDDAALAELLWELTDDPSRPLAGHFLREWVRLRGDGEVPREAVERVVDAFRGRGSTEYSRAPAERTLVDIGAPAATLLLEAAAAPDRARRITGGFDDTRELLELTVRILGDDAPAALDGLMRNPSVGAAARLHAATLARSLFPAALRETFRDLYDARQDHYALQAQALRGLADGGDPDAARLVAEALVRTEGEYPPAMVRLAAAEIMERRPGLRDVGAVRRALETETDGENLARLLALLRGDGGDGAAERVAGFFRDGRAAVRRRAADALAQVPGPDTVTLLLARLDAEDGADSVAGDPDAADLDEAGRRRILESRESVAASLRTSVVTSLRLAAGETATEVLIPLLEHPRADVRGAAADNLATLEDPAASAALARRLRVETRIMEESGVPDATALGLRARMLAALFRCGGPDAAAWVTAVLDAEDEGLRDLVLEEISGGDGRVPVGAALAEFLGRTAPGSTTRLLALKALASDREAPRAALLLELLAASTGFEERRQVLVALGRTGDAAAVPAVARLLSTGLEEDRDPERFATGVQAAETLGDLGAAEAVPHLAALLRAVLPAALRHEPDPRTESARQVATVAVRALGRLRDPAALEILVDLALHPGLSRAAERTTRNEVEFLHGGPPPEPTLPRGTLKRLAETLAAALGRTRDAALARSLERRVGARREDGSAWTVSEEWLTWLGEALGSPRHPHPYRPRWAARMVLVRLVLENAPRDSALDREAARLLFTDATEVKFDAASAVRHLALWRRLMREQDPYAADEDRGLFDSFEAVVAAGAAWKSGDGAATRERYAAALAGCNGDHRVPRLAGTVLSDLAADPAILEEAALDAVRLGPHWPHNHRLLGRVRLSTGDAAGAVEPLEAALALARRRVDPRSWREAYNAPFHYWLARACAATERADAALEHLGTAMRLNDQYMDWGQIDPAFAATREDPRFAELLRRARLAFDE